MTRISSISVIVLTKNEEAGLGNTLAKLRDFDEVIVVDSGSEDRTVEIAEAYGARVVQFSWNGAYPKKKQWAIEQAGVANEWVLLLDADEFPSPSLVAELEGISPELERTVNGAYDINLLYRFAGRYLSHGHVVTKRSLLHVSRAHFPVIDDLMAPGIREVEGHYQPETSHPIGRLKARIVHDDRDPVSSWFDRHNRYSDWEAHLRQDRVLRQEIAGKRTWKGKIFDTVPMKPLLFFFYSYFARLGLLDGRAGFDYALALSVYYWQIGVKDRELVRNGLGEPAFEVHPNASPNQHKSYRVLQVVNTLSFRDGGPARNSYELNLALNKQNNVRADLLWIKPAVDSGVADSEIAGGLKFARTLKRASWRRHNDAIGPLRLIALLKGSDHLVVHGYYLWWIPILVALAKACGTPIVLMPHGSLTTYQQGNSRAKKAAYEAVLGRFVRRHVAAFAVGSDREASEIRARFSSPRSETVGVGVSKPELVAAEDFTTIHSLRPYLLSFSRLASKKRIELAIAALAELRTRGEDLRLVIAGDGDKPYVDFLRNFAKDAGVEGHVDFVGLTTGARKTAILTEAEVLLAPSRDENFGIAVAEAVAHGTPVVASAEVEAAKHLPDTVCVRLENVTAQSLADAVIEMRRMDREETRKIAVRTAEETYSWSAVSSNWLALLAESGAKR